MAYTNIDDPSAHFQTAAYTGTGSSHAITNDGNSDMQPDWVWIKTRSHAAWHSLHDSSRGATKGLFTNDANVEVNHTDSLTSFNSDGFTLGADSSGGSVNVNTRTYVGWQWAANSGTTSSNTDGNITSTVQSNQDAGFSIVTYTGNGSNNQTIGHGLGVQPSWWIVKRRNGAANWFMGASSILGGTSNYLLLNSTAANAEINNIWGDSPTSSTLFRVSNNAGLNASGGTYVAYLFANKQGYSKFGKYVGNGNANGTFVYTGFKPAFIMCKRIDGAGNSWDMHDSARDPFNPSGRTFYADTAGAELTGNNVDLLSNGFKQRDTSGNRNGNGNTYIYMAFAENPFVTSTGIPTTAR